MALLESLDDLYSLPSGLISSIKVIGVKKLAERVDWLLENRETVEDCFGPFESVKIRRVQAIPDAEGKSRVIAMLDYFSQTALYPLHKYLFRVLAAIPQDVTFNQGSFVDKVRDWGDGVWYSVDLSKATDRFPIDLITLVLSGHFPDEYIRSWRDVMVGYPFSSSQGEVRYSTGNPMGAYSSWATFALAHHFIMYTIARERGRS